MANILLPAKVSKTKWRYRMRLVSDLLKTGAYNKKQTMQAVTNLYWVHNGDRTDNVWNVIYSLSKEKQD